MTTPQTTTDRLIHAAIGYYLISAHCEDDPALAILNEVPLGDLTIEALGIYHSILLYYALTGAFPPSTPGKCLEQIVSIADTYRDAFPENYAKQVKRLTDDIPTMVERTLELYEARHRQRRN